VRLRENFTFLYRQDEGRIDRATYWRAAAPVLLVLAAMTAIWIAVMPRGARDLAHEAFFDGRVAATYLYALIFALALLIGAVMLYFLGAKRLRDVGRPPWLAGFPFLALFFDGALRWAAARSEGALGEGALFVADVIAIAAVVWAVIDMGLRRGRPGTPP
jgi:uncharacterized membrane protein YhaH (DUF805 family)